MQDAKKIICSGSEAVREGTESVYDRDPQGSGYETITSFPFFPVQYLQIIDGPSFHRRPSILRATDWGESSRRVWGPITLDEVKGSGVQNDTAKEPDGNAVSSWNKLPPKAASLFFNLFLLEKRLPDKLERTKTVFIPKTENPETPANYRPISIASVIAKHLHRIIAMRYKKLKK